MGSMTFARKMTVDAGFLPSLAPRPSTLILRGRTPAWRSFSSTVDTLELVPGSRLVEERNAVAASFRALRIS